MSIGGNSTTIHQTDNLDFVSNIFPDTYPNAHVCLVPNNPYEADPSYWGGGPYRDYEERLVAETNNYFCVSTFSGKRRTKDSFQACYLILLDDIGDGASAKIPMARIRTLDLPEPSYRLLTSPGNEQWGYRLEPPCEERWKVERFQNALVAKGLADPEGRDAGMKGVTRYGRLPLGINGKPAYANGNGPFQCQMLNWQPEETWSLEELAEKSGIDLGVEPEIYHVALDPVEEDPVVEWAQDTRRWHGARQSPLGKQHQMTCFLVAEHTEGVDNGFYYRSPGLFYCHHGSHIDKPQAEWWALLKDIAPEVHAALKTHLPKGPWTGDPEDPGPLAEFKKERPPEAPAPTPEPAAPEPAAPEPAAPEPAAPEPAVTDPVTPHDSTDSTDSITWGELQPLKTAVPAGPRFPAEALPKQLGAFVEALSEATQTPPGMGGALVLGACATGLQGRVNIEVREGYFEPLNLFIATIAPPASRKSAVFRVVKQPIDDEEVIQKGALRLQVRKNQQAVNSAKKRLAKLENKLGGEDDAITNEQIDDLTESMLPLEDARLHMPRLTVGDITPEALATKMCEQEGRMAVWHPEGGDMFDIAGGRYSSDGKGNFGIFLAGHAGDAWKVDRRVGEPQEIPEAILTVATTLQPGVVAALCDSGAFRDRGLIARFCWIFPESWVGRRKISPDAIPRSLVEAYQSAIARLFRVNSTPVLATLRISPEARNRWVEFAEEVEPTLEPRSGTHAHMADWAGKMCGLVGRLAGILHCLEQCEMERDPLAAEVGGGTMSHAITLGRWMLAHAEVTYDFIERRIDNEELERVWVGILRETDGLRERSFGQRDLLMRVKRDGYKSSTLEAALTTIARKGYIQRGKEGKRVVWAIHPKATIDGV